MKKTVNWKGTIVPLAEMGSWTYDEAEIGERVAGISVGLMALSELSGTNSRTALGFAAVSLFRAGVEFDPATLGRETLDDLIVDFIGTPDVDEATEGETSPPVEAAAVDVESDETAAEKPAV
jgi:hypothetical protein